ncbi:hypothetical protein [Maribacter antarcticus]|uniref:hypothetical protein n=1 Tax=Maribacter antarcticus TaxID=505250 RepID=UPI00047C7060|nr:hypothetical protein [Maribacter antarcticus]
MRRFLIVLLYSSLCSCNFFESKEKRTQELIDSQLNEIDWNSIDTYPLFLDCDETASKEVQRHCFEGKLIAHFETTLNQFEFIVDSDENPIVAVIFVIDSDGDIAILDIEKDRFILNQMPEFDGIVTQSLKTVPEIAPALKRGIPVSTKFRIPIQLNTK